MGRYLALLLILPALAGCATAPDEGRGGCAFDDLALCDLEAHYASHMCVQEDVRPRVYAPDSPSPGQAADPWMLGDWWEYRLVVDGKDHGTTKLVYYGDQDIVAGEAQHYMVGTTREQALEHALFSTNPVLGRIHRTLYSPHESGVHADMFHFPLCEGSAWSTKFFGRDFTLAASQAPVPTGAAMDPGFLILGRATDGSKLEVTYSPEAKWFTTLVLERADGVRVDMRMTAHGGGYMGEAFFLRGQNDAVFDLALQPPTTDLPMVPGKEGAYDAVGIFIDVTSQAGDNRIEVRVRDPDGVSQACVGIAGSGPLQGTLCERGPVMVEVPWREGTWTLEIQEPALGDVEVTGEARVVSIYDRSGSV